ncbi:Proton-translocating ferredoxin:NAD(+) oxidoreductase complex subunit C [subsurface metagenome]
MKTFRQGLHLVEKKELSEDKKIKKISSPPRVILPLSQHTGAPGIPLVKVGDLVEEGQKIADADSFISSPIHASISGKVSSIEKLPHPVGGEGEAIIIEGNGNGRKVWEKGEVSSRSLEAKEIRKIIREAGIVGLGGAAFPTHVKLSPPENKPIDTIILNGCECEPYLTGDHRLMLERADDCLYGLRLIIKVTGATRGYVGIESNKGDAIALMREKLKAKGNIQVVPLKTKYPQGGEKMLIKAILNREVPSGGLPLDVGVVVSNVGTALAIAEAIKWGKPLLERVVTITGSGVSQPANLWVPLGTPFSCVVEECGGLKENASKVIMGGPMMGLSQYTLDVPVIKGTSGILVLTESEAVAREEEPCIKCARCIDHCPMSLVPTILARLVKAERWDSLKDYGVMDCIECGCCAYVCPSKIPLVHLMKLGKFQVSQRQA